MIGRRTVALVGLVLGGAVAGSSAPARAQTQAEAPPPVPSSYEMRRVETKVRVAAEQAARDAKRRSRQVEYTGAGTTAGDADTGLAIDITPRQAADLLAAGIIGYAAFRALTVGTEPDPFGAPSDGASASAGGSTTTTTGSN